MKICFQKIIGYYKKQTGKKVYISAHFMAGNVWKVEVNEKLEICRGVLPLSLA